MVTKNIVPRMLQSIKVQKSYYIPLVVLWCLNLANCFFATLSMYLLRKFGLLRGSGVEAMCSVCIIVFF